MCCFESCLHPNTKAATAHHWFQEIMEIYGKMLTHNSKKYCSEDNLQNLHPLFSVFSEESAWRWLSFSSLSHVSPFDSVSWYRCLFLTCMRKLQFFLWYSEEISKLLSCTRTNSGIVLVYEGRTETNEDQHRRSHQAGTEPHFKPPRALVDGKKMIPFCSGTQWDQMFFTRGEGTHGSLWWPVRLWDMCWCVWPHTYELWMVPGIPGTCPFWCCDLAVWCPCWFTRTICCHPFLSCKWHWVWTCWVLHPAAAALGFIGRQKAIYQIAVLTLSWPVWLRANYPGKKKIEKERKKRDLSLLLLACKKECKTVFEGNAWRFPLQIFSMCKYVLKGLDHLSFVISLLKGRTWHPASLFFSFVSPLPLIFPCPHDSHKNIMGTRWE